MALIYISSFVVHVVLEESHSSWEWIVLDIKAKSCPKLLILLFYRIPGTNIKRALSNLLTSQCENHC